MSIQDHVRDCLFAGLRLGNYSVQSSFFLRCGARCSNDACLRSDVAGRMAATYQACVHNSNLHQISVKVVACPPKVRSCGRVMIWLYLVLAQGTTNAAYNRSWSALPWCCAAARHLFPRVAAWAAGIGDERSPRMIASHGRAPTGRDKRARDPMP